MSIEATNEKHVRPDKGKKNPKKGVLKIKPKVTLKIDKCAACGHVKIGNICVNKLCITNKRPA